MNKIKLKTIFFGNNDKILEILSQNSNIMAIFCRPSEINDENIIKIKKVAKIYSIPIEQPYKKDIYNFVEYIKKLNVDLMIVCGYKYIIPNEIFALSKLGTINIHPSYLPAYRGQHVINWAIINGEKETGITIHFIDEGIDTGDIIIQKKVPISFEDSANTLHQKVYCEAGKLLEHILMDIASGKQIQRKNQDDAEATYFRPRTPEDGYLNWNKSGLEIYNLVRALVKPWPGAYSYINGKKIIIWHAKFENTYSHEDHSNGEIIDISDSNATIKVHDGIIIITDYTIVDDNQNQINYILKVGDILK